MKYLIITAIKAFEEEIKAILKKADVNKYTYIDATSYRDFSKLSMQDNWFANEMNEGESILFYLSAENEQVDTIFEMAAAFNEKQETMSSIHVDVLNIERSL